MGERAEVQFKAMLEHIPPGTRDKKILLLYYPSDLAPRATYSMRSTRRSDRAFFA